jgi:hypothetical protein
MPDQPPRPPEWVIERCPPGYENIWTDGEHWLAIWCEDEDDIELVAGLIRHALLNA